MNVEMGTEAPAIPRKEIHKRIFVAVQHWNYKWISFRTALFRPARLDLHESGIIGKPFKSTSTAIGS
jgi:hypothetical protein